MNASISLRVRRAAVAAAALLGSGMLASCGGESASADVPVVDVQLGPGYTITPNQLTVPAGDAELRVTNTDTMVHDLVVAGRGTAPLAPGQTQVLSINTEPGSYQMWCDQPGHRQMGQQGKLISVEQAATPAAD
ncbi:MAG: cupredoxin domain-containing protein [Actinobacteria bacterium]|nr:cupredoxin domain-containing protein [Actinomycetota bacterium]